MVNIEQLKDAIREKQQIISNNLAELSYKELLKLVSNINGIIGNLENLHTKNEVLCNKIIADHMEADSRASFSKVEAIMKSSSAYIEYKKVANLKQCASREVALVKMHLQYVLSSGVEEKD